MKTPDGLRFRFRPPGSVCPSNTWRILSAGLLAATALAALPRESLAQGDQLQETALEQIRALIEEKAARTDAQRRLDSQLLLDLRRRRGHAVARAVPELSTGIETDPDGGTLVDIQADVSGALLARIEALGGVRSSVNTLATGRFRRACRSRVSRRSPPMRPSSLFVPRSGRSTTRSTPPRETLPTWRRKPGPRSE